MSKSKATYVIASHEGAKVAGLKENDQPYEVGEAVELDLDKRTEKSVVDAGWLKKTEE
jgi:hypothetical protein